LPALNLPLGSALLADSSGKLSSGKSYVVFGKADNTAINLSAIASGTGGFVIIGENAGDVSGASVSTAGDVNGDGLDDLIVGALDATPSDHCHLVSACQCYRHHPHEHDCLCLFVQAIVMIL
jgi:hypothetical protein